MPLRSLTTLSYLSRGPKLWVCCRMVWWVWLVPCRQRCQNCLPGLKVLEVRNVSLFKWAGFSAWTAWVSLIGKIVEGLALRAVEVVHTVKDLALLTKQFICTVVYTDRITLIVFSSSRILTILYRFNFAVMGKLFFLMSTSAQLGNLKPPLQSPSPQ